MSSNVTRRQLAAALAAAVSASAAQTDDSSRAPAADLADAQEQMRKHAGAIAKVPVPQTLEPAFTFRA